MNLKKFALLAFVATPILAMAQTWMDLTDEYIQNPNFDNNMSTGWTYTSDAHSQVVNYNAMEFWQGTFNIYQTLAVPNGKYRISVQAYFRTNSNDIAYQDYQNNTENITGYLYANDERVKIASIYSASSTTNYANNCWNAGNWRNPIYFPNGMASAAEFFKQGYYQNTIEVEVTNNELKFGLINEVWVANNWCMFDNFRLEYYGNLVNITSVKMSETDIELSLGDKTQLQATILPTNATYRGLEWSSDDTDVATVDNNGNVIATGVGTTTITAASVKDNTKYATCTVKVTANTEGTSSLIINEIQTSNVDMFVDPSFNYGGWIEIYNPTDKPVTLIGLHVSDDPNNLKKFKLPLEVGGVPAKGFKNVWFDHYETKYSQVNFKLDFDGGVIYLSDNEGNLITSQDYPIAVPRTSYARTTDGGTSWGLTAEPTPARSNATSTFAVGRLEAPVVDKDAQLFNSPFTVSVNIPSGATLRYTVDGSTPTLDNGYTSQTGLFNVSSTTTYRFRLFKEGSLPSEVITRSYLYKDRDIVFPVISVVTDPVNLFDDSLGIYVRGVNGRTGNGQQTPCNWNMDWDRPVNFEYITPEEGMVLNQEVDMAMCGGWSRAWEPHSFKLKAAKIYEGRNSMNYTFFDDKQYLKHKTLQIRNGGNDTGSRIKDPALQEIVRQSGLDIDCQAYQPIVHFINGQYKGMLNMREPNNKHFAYANYGYDSDEVDQFEMSPDSGYCQKEGTKDSFLKWHELSANAADPEVYSEICNMVDIDEYINYMAVEFYLGATDWPQNNVKAFKPRFKGGKFRFVLFDLDGTFGTTDPFNTFEWKKTYTFDLIYDTGTRFTEEIEFVTIFLNMLSNEEFVKKFIDTYCLVAGSVFTPERCSEIINAMAENTYSTLQQEGQNPYNTGNGLINSLNNRQQTMINALKNYWRFNLSGIEEQKVELNSNIDEARIRVNNMVVPTNKFAGSLFSPITLKANAPANYKFVGWRSNNGEAIEMTLFSKGDSWNYYDQGSLDGENWTAANYDATSWGEGNAPLGYYTSDSNNGRGYNTFLDYGSDANNKRPTYYFRKEFTINNTPTENDVVSLDYTVDDGMIIYINGVEASRYLMNSGDITYNSFSSTYANNNPDSGKITLPISLFKKGRNVIAVEVHNNNGNSSDIYFDASLSLLTYNGENSYISLDEEFQMPTTGNLSLTACYEPLTEEELAETYTTPVKVNEVCASNSIYVNEYFEKNDWIELYNTTGKDFDIAGMYISDNINKPLKYQIPTDGIVNTIIKPHGHMVIWADKLEPLSQLHTSFKLGAEGGEVVLTSADQTWCDTLVYAAHNGDFSVGLYPDGGTNAYIMSKTTIGATNEINSYSVFWDEPFIPNAIKDIQITRNGTLGITFADNTINLHSEESGKANVYVYALAGQTVMEQNITLTGSTEHIGLHHLPNGTYVVKATDHNGNICTIKVLKQ